jgi:hypothetical protein
MAGDADATSVETNPGQLGLLDGASLALVVDHWGDRTPRVGRGQAILLGAPLFGGLSLGAGFQFCSRPSSASPSGTGSCSWGEGWRCRGRWGWGSCGIG